MNFSTRFASIASVSLARSRASRNVFIFCGYASHERGLRLSSRSYSPVYRKGVLSPCVEGCRTHSAGCNCLCCARQAPIRFIHETPVPRERSGLGVLELQDVFGKCTIAALVTHIVCAFGSV